MATIGSKFKKVVRTWVLPPGYLMLLLKIYLSVVLLNKRIFSANQFRLGQNKLLFNRHKDGRCFILCNGPSTQQQDLLPLKNEIVISVSSGYLHKDFDVIAPKYHCVPNVTWNCAPSATDGKLTEERVVKWFKEMDKNLGDAELFLGHTEYELVQKHKLFKGRKVHYLCMEGSFEDDDGSLIDLSAVIPGPQSVSIMGLMLAMYLGFKKIYLLGTDHDSLQLGSYKYAFEPTVFKGFGGVDTNGNVTGSMYSELCAYATLWQQYRNIKNIAAQNGVLIFNATQGGALDEFERVKLSSLWDSSVQQS